MKIVKLQQGTPEWHAFRALHFTASDAPAMMGVSKYKSRAQLIKEKATGFVPEPTDYQQRLFDAGHAAEAEARIHADKAIGDNLYPVTGESSDRPTLAASFDGRTMNGKIIWEHKLWNESKAGDVRASQCPMEDFYQVQHQLLVSGAEYCRYTVSDGTEVNSASVDVYPDEQAFASLIAGWDQFAKDVAAYHEAPVSEVITGANMDALPALHIEVTGMVTASNLDAFKETALAAIKSINRDLETDQHFADAEKAVKWCKDIEGRLEAAKQHALSQTASIDELFRAIDQISAEARQSRLDLDKLVKARKESIRSDIAMEAAKEMAAHVEQINATLDGKVRLPAIATDFPGVMKGKKTVASLRDAASTELARAKIEANKTADHIRASLIIVDEYAAEHGSLLSDLQQLVIKDHDDLRNLIKARIADAEAEAQRRAERQKIAQQEPAKPTSSARSAPTAKQVAPAIETEPSADEIVSVLSEHYGQPEHKIRSWLCSMDFSDKPF